MKHILNKEQNTSKIMIPFTVPVVLICLFAGLIGCGGVYLLKQDILLGVQCGYMFIVLMYAAMVDLKMKLVSNWTHILLLVSALIPIVRNLVAQDYFALIPYGVGFLLLPLPLLLSAIMSKNNTGIGGGDIKLMAVVGLNIGVVKGFYALAIGLVLAIVIMGVQIARKKTNKTISFAFVPYLAVGTMIASFI